MRYSLSLGLLLSALGYADAVRFLGRVNPATKELTWPGTGVAFAFTGSSANIDITVNFGSSSAELIVDGGVPTIIDNVTGPIPISNLTRGSHTVVLRKRSEYYFGTFNINNVTTNGKITSDKIPSRRIEYIGDSITVGYGLDGVNPCTNTAQVEDNPKTYDALAASSLGADYSVIAWSGKGLTRNYASSTPDTTPLQPELWTKYGAGDVADNTYPFPAAAAPQAVVIALGTNDFSYLGVRDPLNATVFTNAYVSFVKTVHLKYPKAQFFLLGSPLLSDSYPTAADAQHTTLNNALTSTVAQVKPAGIKATFVDWPPQGADSGCDYHPNAATHAAEAPVLAAAIKKALGW